MIDKYSYTLRIDTPSWHKFQYISNKNKRSLNKQLELIIELFIAAYEKENGEIQIDSEE